MSKADVALVNFESPLVDPNVQAIGITNGRFSHAWTSRRDISAQSELDADGATVLPGIDDSHLHGYEYGRSLTAVDLGVTAAPTLEDFCEVLRMSDPETSGWIRGIGWDGTDFPGSGPGGTLSRDDIDDATGSTPVILTDITGHQALVNSAALAAAGIDHNTPDPPGGSFLRDDSGQPTGLVLEAAVGLLNEAIPPLSGREQQAAILQAQEALVRHGVVAFTDPGLGPGARTLMDGTGDLAAIEAYRSLDSDQKLRMRVNIMLLFGGLGGTTAADVETGLQAFGSPTPMEIGGRLGISQVKVFADGIPRSRTAWMSDPYDDCSHGKLQVAGDSDSERVKELHEIIRIAASRGWQVGLHAIGDQAIEHVVDALVASENRPHDLRHYVIHGDFVSPTDLVRMGESGITLNSNPSIRWQVGGSVAPIIGELRNNRRQPLRSAVDSGVNVCLSSDAPVSPPDWRVIVAAAMTRSWRADPKKTDREKLSAREALKAMTINASWQSRSESWRGDFRIGHCADFIQLDRTIDWDEPWTVADSVVVRTVIGGKTAFER